MTTEQRAYLLRRIEAAGSSLDLHALRGDVVASDRTVMLAFGVRRRQLAAQDRRAAARAAVVAGDVL